MNRHCIIALQFLAFRRQMIYLVISLMMLPLCYTAAQDIPVDIRTQITIFKTLLTFDRTIRTDSTGTFHIAVIYQSKFRKSTIARDEVVAKLYNNGIRVKLIDVDLDTTPLSDIIGRNNVAVLLVCPLRSFNIHAVTDFSRKHGILSMTVVPEYVSKGIAIGIDVKESKPQILLNRTTAKLENADFDSRLFRFVRIIETAE